MALQPHKLSGSARRWLDDSFRLGIILKGLDGGLEIVGGILLMTVHPAAINRLAVILTTHELSEDPRDFVATHILRSAQHLADARLFGAVYLLLHGVVKVMLVAALLRNRLWAYPWMIGFLSIFTIYQVYRISLTGSVGLSLLTIFDLAIIWLTWREYKLHQAR